MNGARAAIAVMLTATACASASPAVEQRTTQGPEAMALWMYRVGVANGREPTFEERAHWERQLDLAIGRYLATDPEFANSPDVTTFRFLRQTSVGMSREQIAILLGPPERTTTDVAEIQTLAGRYWPEIRAHAREAWVYPMGWRFYFAESRVVDITQYQPR